MNKKVLLAALVGVLLVGFLGLNFVAYNQAYSMLHFSNGGSRTNPPEKLSVFQKIRALVLGINIPRPHGTNTPNSEDLVCENYPITQQSGIQLGAWFCPNESNESLVILFHGYATDKSSLLKEARVFHELGWSALLVDFRGSGDSSESYTSIGYYEADDVAAAVTFAKSNLPHSRLALFGQSMGGVAILRAINEHHIQADALIVEAVFDTMLNTVKNRFKSMGIPSFPAAELLIFWGGKQLGFDAFANNPVEYAAGLNLPILFLHGANDPRARVEQGRRVFSAAASKRKQFEEFANVKHEDCLARFPSQWKESVRGFLSATENKSLEPISDR